eukprot:2424849-Alexandrium_andersonii.AAC.1
MRARSPQFCRLLPQRAVDFRLNSAMPSVGGPLGTAECPEAADRNRPPASLITWRKEGQMGW